MTETIGWIGLGQMGHRMSRHLAAAGHALVVADAATTERAPPGSKVARSNAEVAALADIVILSLPDGTVSEAVAREIAAASPRKVRTVIDTSTIGIKAAEAVAAILAKAGHRLRRRAGVGRHGGGGEGHARHHARLPGGDLRAPEAAR